MSWLSKLERPRISRPLFGKKEDAAKRELQGDLWIKCPKTGEMLYRQDLEQTQWVTKAGVHMRITPEQRFKYLFDEKFTIIPSPTVVEDPLKFTDDQPYHERLKRARAKTGRIDAMAIAVGSLGRQDAVAIVQDFGFMGGSLGMAAGEAFIRAAEEAVDRHLPLICFPASGGARMQEGTLSLMQMARTTLAIQAVKAAGLPYIVVLTDPTSGGVTASYAMLGDLHIGEPGAMIAFSGPRVIEQTIRQKLPEGFQRSEFLREKGMLDMVVDRRKLRETLSNVLDVLLSGREHAA